MAWKCWLPKALDVIWIGEAFGLIRAIQMHGKPIGEIGSARAKRSDILEDLRGCLKIMRNPKGIFPWIRPAGGGRYRFGYFSQPWTLRALTFLDRTTLKQTDRSWIGGLLYGYRPDLIQQFIDNGYQVRPKRRRRPSRA